MKLLVSTALISLAAALPLTAVANGGTITFFGALVEPTCEAKVMDAQPHPGQLAVRLHGCLLPSPVQPASAHAGTETSAQLRRMALSAYVAAIAGRDHLEVVTMAYH